MNLKPRQKRRVFVVLSARAARRASQAREVASRAREVERTAALEALEAVLEALAAVSEAMTAAVTTRVVAAASCLAAVSVSAQRLKSFSEATPQASTAIKARSAATTLAWSSAAA